MVSCWQTVGQNKSRKIIVSSTLTWEVGPSLPGLKNGCG
jgi:hypothetical protein